MKIRALFFTACSILAVPALRAADQAPAGPHEAEDHEHTELGDHMEDIGHAFRKLGRQVGDPTKNEESLKLVARMRKNAEASATLKPAKTADIPEDQRAKFLADFDKGMKALLIGLDQLSADLKAGNNEAAAADLKQLKKLMQDSHKEFQKKKDRM